MKKNRKGLVLGLVVGSVGGAVVASKITRKKVEVEALNAFSEVALEYVEDMKKEMQIHPYGTIFELDKISFDSWREASEIMQNLCNIIEDYGHVSVQDFFNWLAEDRYSYAATKYGWEDMDGTAIVSRKGKYYIEFQPYYRLSLGEI